MSFSVPLYGSLMGCRYFIPGARDLPIGLIQNMTNMLDYSAESAIEIHEIYVRASSTFSLYRNSFVIEANFQEKW